MKKIELNSKNKKRYKTSAKERQKRILKRYYKLDGNVATVELFFDSFSDLIEKSFGNNSVERLNGVLMSKIEEAFMLLPRRYKLNVNVIIKSYGEYEDAEAERIIKENIELRVYSLKHDNFRHLLTTLWLLGGGAVLLLVSYFLQKHSSPTLLNDIANITGTLLVWEAGANFIFGQGANIKQVRQFTNKLVGLNVMSIEEYKKLNEISKS